MLNKKSLLVAALAAAVSAPALATNGYAPHGVGIKSKSMGGVGIALPQDSIAAGLNPAGMVHVGNRFDIGGEFFRPIRSTTITGNGQPGQSADGFYDASAKKIFFIPEFGYNRMLNDNMSVGISVFGNGGMNTDFVSVMPLLSSPRLPDGSPNPFAERSGINLEQLFIVPSFSMKINDKHSIGIGINLVVQQFGAKGLQNFAAPAGTPFQVSESPDKVTHNGDRDTSYGIGVRIGWLGQLTDRLSVGLTYQSKTSMSDFDDYSGLFAEGGGFDIPENYGIGIAFKATPKLTVAFDVVQINFGDITSISNPIDKLFTGNLLGSSDGPGFGWEDQTVYKLGLSYQYNDKLMLRAGWNHGDAPMSGPQTLFNTLAPATVEDHLTLGLTWALSPTRELTFSYMHAFENTINGRNSIPPNFGGGEANIKMYQDSFGIAFGMKM